jgi:protein SCO1
MMKPIALALATLGLASLSLVWVRDNLIRSAVVQDVSSAGSSLEASGCCCTCKEEVGTLTDKSVYQLGSSWIRHDNQTINLRQLRGRIQVMAMIFTRCPSSCPRLVEDMKHLQSQLGTPYRDAVGYVLVSLDPDRDSPQVLKEYSESRDLRGDSWTLLHGDPEDVRELAAVLGVRYKKVGERDIAHSNLISVLNKEGELVYQQEDLNVDPTAIMQAIQTTLGSGR